MLSENQFRANFKLRKFRGHRVTGEEGPNICPQMAAHVFGAARLPNVMSADPMHL